MRERTTASDSFFKLAVLEILQEQGLILPKNGEPASIARERSLMWMRGLPELLLLRTILLDLNLIADLTDRSDFQGAFLEGRVQKRINWKNELALLGCLIDALVIDGYIKSGQLQINVKVCSFFIIDGIAIKKNSLRASRGKGLVSAKHQEIVDEILKRLNADNTK